MSTISDSSSLSERKDKKYYYAVREEHISHHANNISKKVQDGAFLEIEWTDVVKGAGGDIDCLIVFVTGSSDCNRMLDVLSGIRERVPRVKSIIAVIICTTDNKDHAKYCSSIENHTFKTENDISFEYFVFSDGTPHECSHNIDKIIEFQLNEIAKNDPDKLKKKLILKETNSRINMKQLTEKAKQPCKTKNDLDNLEKSIEEYRKLNQDLSTSKDFSCAETVLAQGRSDIEQAEKQINKLVKMDSQRGKNEKYLDNLEKIITECEKFNLKDNDDLLKAKDILAKRRLEKRLEDAIHKGLWENLDEEIRMTNGSKFKSELETLLSKANKKLNELNKHHRLEKAMKEVHKCKNPSQVIDDVMMTILNLCEGNQSKWQYITGQPEELLKKIKNIDERSVSKRTCKDVMEKLKKYTVDEVREVSDAAAIFYEWAYEVSERNIHKDQQQ